MCTITCSFCGNDFDVQKGEGYDKSQCYICMRWLPTCPSCLINDTNFDCTECLEADSK